jgi:hypothetical protein
VVILSDSTGAYHGLAGMLNLARFAHNWNTGFWENGGIGKLFSDKVKDRQNSY